MRKFFASRFAAALVLALVAAAPAAAADAQPLVSAAWLSGHLRDANLVVLDIRSAIDGSKPETFAQAHIPGAVHSDYDKAGWRVTRNNVPFMVPTTAELEKLIGDLGIDETSHVVVVPAGVNVLDFGSAARTYWTLKYAGVSDVSILDGGLAGWKAAGYALDSGAHVPSPAIFTATIDNSILALAPDVEKIEQSGGASLVDARPVSFFLGKEKAPAASAYGHIPGALNIDSAQFYDPAANRLKPKAELAAIASELPQGATITYCNTGHWASTDWFVLHELLGRKNAKLYAGSMVEWTSNASRPIESARTKWDDLKKKLGLGT
ncbi:MAG TPA: sulfurtransferase [Pseudolabrys sp.]|jgi:thiosulfate/3-mercaptopyruvate sulfurtransferase